MDNNRQFATLNFGSGFTSLGKKMLIGYGVIYVLELLATHWLGLNVVNGLAIHPVGSTQFGWWQVLTHPFIHNPYGPIGFLITCLVFYFFSSPVQQFFGPTRFLTFFYIAAAGGLVCGLPLANVQAFSVPFMGMSTSILAMVVVFGFLNPEATILLMFVLPIKAKYMSYATIAITAILFLAKADSAGAYHLGGIGAGYLYYKYGGRSSLLLWFKTRYFSWKMKRLKKRFTVLDGGKGKDDNKPTYH
ncbi:MAG: rhomboid family intramembrane serine protease [Desulfatibacillum sp.]|nr:rhomboid family intramembrane serine protease [Desulfatibacillum sp.]